MRKIALAALALALAVPAVAHADGSTKSSAEKLCRAERGTTQATRDAFAQKYGTNKNKKNAFGRCVSKQAAALVDDSKAEIKAQVAAAQACATERGTTAESRAAFAQKYGTNKNKKNAFGKCVSKTAAAKGDA